MAAPPPPPGAAAGGKKLAEFERLSLPWETPQEPKEVEQFETPGLFVIQFLSFQFAKLAKEQLDIWYSKDDVTLSSEFPLEQCSMPLAKLLQSMGKAAKQCLSPLVGQLFAWRQTMLSKAVPPEQQRKKFDQLKAAGKKFSDKEVASLLEEKRVLFVDFLYSQSLYIFLRSNTDTPLAADVSARVEESIFSFYAVEPSKFFDSASQANRQLNALYFSRVLGLMSGLSAPRMSAITKRFFLEIEQKDFFSKRMSVAEFMIPHIRSLKFDIQSAEGLKNAVSFLEPINKNWKDWTKKGRLRLAFSLMLGGVLQPLVTITQVPGVNYADWEAALKNLYSAATAAAKKKDKKSWQMLPLEVPLVSLQSADLFYQNLEPLTDAIMNNIKDTTLRQISLEALFCITLCYFTKYPDPNIQRVGKFLQALIAGFYPKRKDFPIHKESVDIYVDILTLLSIYQRDTVFKNFVLEFLSMKDYGFNPETIIIGLLTVLNISNRTKKLEAIKTESLMMSIGSLDVSPGYDWRKESMRELVESRWAIKEEPVLNEDELSKFNKSLQPILAQVDSLVGNYLKNSAQKDLLLKNRDNLYVLDLLRVLLYAFRKTLPIGISTSDFLAVVSKLTIHAHEGICEEAWGLLVHLMNTRVKLRPAIVTVYSRLVSSIQDTHVGVLRIAIKNMIGLLEQWIGEINRNPNNVGEVYTFEKVDVAEFEAGEIEGLALVLLCNTDSQTRAGGFELISLVSTLCEKLGDFKTNRVQALLKEHRAAIIAKSFHFRSVIQLDAPAETREDTIQSISSKTEEADWHQRWSRILGALASHAVASSVETSSFAWKAVTPRIAALYPTIEGSMRTGEPPEDKVALWRNYLCLAFALSAVSDEGGDSAQTPNVTINTFRDLFRLMVPFLNNDVKSFREPAETALGFVPTVMMASMFKETSSFEVAFGDEKQHKLKKRARDRVLTMISFIYRVALQNIVTAYGQRGGLSKPTAAHLQPKIFNMMEQQLSKYYALAGTDYLPDQLFWRYNLAVYAELVVVEATSTDLDIRLLLTDRVYSVLFNWLIEACGEGATSKEVADADFLLITQAPGLTDSEKDSLKNDLLTIRTIAFRALQTAFLFPINDREEELLWSVINNAFKSPYRQIRATARAGLHNVVKKNPDRKAKVANFLVDKSYSNDLLISQGFFLALSSLFSEVELNLPLPVALNLAIFKLGDPLDETRNSAVSLVNQICRKHFGGQYYPLEINTKTYDTYYRSQAVLSAQFARDYPDLTIDMFNEAMKRLQLVDDLSIDRVLSYLNPWLRNIALASLDDKIIVNLLEHLCVVTLKYGETFLDTLVDAWLAFASNATNPISILDYLMLTSVETRNHYFISIATRIAMVIMKEHPQQVVDYLVDELDNITLVGVDTKDPQAQAVQPEPDRTSPTWATTWALSELLPSHPEAFPLSRGNVAMKFLIDALLQRKKDEFGSYVHIMLQAGVLSIDDKNSYVAENAKLLLANVVHCLVSQTPDNEAAASLIHRLSGPKQRGVALWRLESVSTEVLKIDSTSILSSLVQDLVSVLDSVPGLAENWSYGALRWASKSFNQHHITRCLQIFRALNYPLSSQALAYVLSIFSRYVNDKTATDCSIVLETLYTLQSLVENQPVEALNGFPQVFWAAVAALYLEVHPVYLVALRLISTFLDKLDFKSGAVSSILLDPSAAPSGWSPGYRGLQPLILKGLIAEQTEADSLNLLMKITPLLPVNPVFDENETTRLLDNIVGLLPWITEHFKTPEGQAAAGQLGATCVAMGVPDLGAAFSSFAEDKYTTAEEFLEQFSAAFRAAYSPAHDLRTLAMLVEVMQKSPNRNPKVMFAILHHLLSKADLSQGDIKNKALLVFQFVSNNLRGPLWKEALQIIYAVSQNSEKVKPIEFSEIEESAQLKQSIAAYCKLSGAWANKTANSSAKKAVLQIVETLGDVGKEVLTEMSGLIRPDDEDGVEVDGSTPRGVRKNTLRKGSQPPSPLMRQVSLPASGMAKAGKAGPPLERAQSNWTGAFKRSAPSPAASKRSPSTPLLDRSRTPRGEEADAPPKSPLSSSAGAGLIGARSAASPPSLGPGPAPVPAPRPAPGPAPASTNPGPAPVPAPRPVPSPRPSPAPAPAPVPSSAASPRAAPVPSPRGQPPAPSPRGPPPPPPESPSPSPREPDMPPPPPPPESPPPSPRELPPAPDSTPPPKAPRPVPVPKTATSVPTPGVHTTPKVNVAPKTVLPTPVANPGLPTPKTSPLPTPKTAGLPTPKFAGPAPGMPKTRGPPQAGLAQPPPPLTLPPGANQ